MELRLLLDGGAPPGAPPGKIEPSRGDGQFDNELTEQAQKLALVEEIGIEPNVPLKTLDPESELEKTSKTESLVPDVPVAFELAAPLLGAHLILGRPEPSRIANVVPNKQIAAARIDGKLNISISTPQGNADVKLDKPIQVIPDPALVSKFAEWAKQFEASHSSDQATPPTDLVQPVMAETQFDPEHLAALNVVYMSKRQITDQPQPVLNADLFLHHQPQMAIVNSKAIPLPDIDKVAQTTAQQVSAATTDQTTEVPNLALVSSQALPTSATSEKQAAAPVTESSEEATSGVTVSTESATAVATARGSSMSEDPSDSDDPNSADPKQDSKTDSTQPLRHTHNPALENAPVADVQKSTDRDPLSMADRQKNIDAITRKIESLAVNSVRNEVRVEMHPPDLGSVSINVKQALHSLSVTLTASNDQVQEALHESRNDLAASLQVKAKQEVNIEIKAGSSQSLPQEQANAHHQRHPQREQAPQSQRPSSFDSAARETKQHTPQTPRVRHHNTFINLEI